MKNEQYEVLLSEIRKIASRVSDAEAGITRIENDLAGDRKEINDFKVKLSTVGDKVTEFEGSIARLSGRLKDTTQNAVAEVMEPMVTSTDKLTTQMKKSKKVFIDTSKSWWQRFLDRWT